MSDDDINAYLPSILNPRRVKKQNADLSQTQNSIISRASTSWRSNKGLSLKYKPKVKVYRKNKENIPASIPIQESISESFIASTPPNVPTEKLEFKRDKIYIEKDSFASFPPALDRLLSGSTVAESHPANDNVEEHVEARKILPQLYKSMSSHTDLGDNAEVDDKYKITPDKPVISLSFGVKDSQSVEVNSAKSNLKRVLFTHKNEDIQVDCDIIEASTVSSATCCDMDEPKSSPEAKKRSAVTVNLEIKKKKVSKETAESKVLILNTTAVEKISHVIVQPPNYKIVKGNFSNGNKIPAKRKKINVLDPNARYGIVRRLRQKSIDSYYRTKHLRAETKGLDVKSPGVCPCRVVEIGVFKHGDEKEMSKNSIYTAKSGPKSPFNSSRVDNGAFGQVNVSPASKSKSPRCSSPSERSCYAAHTPSKSGDVIQFNIPVKPPSMLQGVIPKAVPHHKIVAGTHFAVDAFSYGDIPYVTHYFLTHFHSDHYAGLKRGFCKTLFCSKITADLCITRLGVSPKCITVIKVDEPIRVNGVEVTAIEANHCPGAVMLVFTLPSGRTLLHTGDFRARPDMESYPIFWNKDVHTVYLDTTYCNPRYDFPTQDESLEMALHILRLKKMAVEKAGRKFSSVLIVCGTYTIGKEKFFLAMSRRVGCSVWACPEKDKVLQAVEGRSFNTAPPETCQLHVVPMRDVTHEKLRAYLDSQSGAFSELVAFKPSGWEIGKSPSVEKDNVAIHGIPYSEHSSFSEMIRFVKYLQPKQVIPTVEISGGIRAVQKYFPCPLVHKGDVTLQSKVTDFFSIQNKQQIAAVT